MNGPRSSHKRASMSLSSFSVGPETIRILVGPEREEFVVGRKLLVSSCPFFRQLVDSSRLELRRGNSHLVVALQDQCPDMFDLFCYWINERGDFHDFIDEAEEDGSCKGLHWDLINLHLFAAQIQIPELQDLAMDAIQDLYLRCNWDIKPELIRYVYQDCDPRDSCRLRKWIVAMTTWVLGGLQRAFVADKIKELFDKCPGFWDDYVTHLLKMSKGKLPFHLKNPQLRLPSNNLRGEERQFGYRQCSFHTHRSTVGQKKCPHQHQLPPLPSAAAASSSSSSSSSSSPLTDAGDDLRSLDSDIASSRSVSPASSCRSNLTVDLYLHGH